MYSSSLVETDIHVYIHEFKSSIKINIFALIKHWTLKNYCELMKKDMGQGLGRD